MKNLRTAFWGLTILVSCTQEYRTCDFDSTNEQVKIYSNVLNELVEQHFYNFYLGKDEERIFKVSTSNNADTVKIQNEIIRLQNELQRDTTRFCNIYLDTTFRPQFNTWNYYMRDSSSYATEIRKLISSFSDEETQVIDSLNTMQVRIRPSDIHLCTSKVLTLTDFENQRNKCTIGLVSFSKVFLAKSRKKGILYYSFKCGELCGKGEILVIEKVNNRWTIINGMIMWIS